MKKENKQTKKQLFENTKNKLLLYANQPVNNVLKELDSSLSGLSDDKVPTYQEKYGKNLIGNKNRYRWWKSLLEATILNPFSIILMAIGVLVVTVLSSPDWYSFGIIVAILLVTILLKVIQEARSNKASEKLNEMIENKALVERDNVKKEIPIDEIVPGDIVWLAAGDMIPADMIIISSKDLFITQSTLTGESEPCEKFNTNTNKKTTNPLELTNVCYMGTTVASGTAYGVVVNTANNTYLGRMAKTISKKRTRTSFDKGISSVSLLLMITTIVMVITVFLLQGFISQADDRWIQALTFSLALAVGLTPELLPMILTANLAKQSFKMAKQKTIVKNINSIQAFGAMDVLCTDKTGTLTEDHIVLERHINVEGKDDKRVLMYGFLNSQFQTGLKNVLDRAIIDKANNEHVSNICNQFVKIDEIPFTFTRRRMSIIIDEKDNNDNIRLITKGAIEEILKICTVAEYKGKVVKIDKKLKEKILTTTKLMNEQGMRVIGVATNNIKLSAKHQFSEKDEVNMKLIGYITLLDPPKFSAKSAIHDLQKKGVQVKVLTGDNDIVARYICEQVGIRGAKVLLGEQIENMTDEHLRNVVMKYSIFAKLAPDQKVRIVNAIKFMKHSVGFMGDGINDAGAMRAADLGISVDTAVDIAKESADIILLEKDLNILGKGCVEGRKTYANIIKYIKMTVSSNFGNMLSMLVASIWLASFNILPMRPEQILMLNLIYDLAQISLPWDNVDEDFYSKPRNWNAGSILKFMLFIGPISSIFDITTFLILFYVLKINDGTKANDLSFFQTTWFLESLLTQSAVILVLRSNKPPFIRTRPSMAVVTSVFITTIVGLILSLTPHLEPIFVSLTIHPIILLYITAIIVGYATTAQLSKMLYIKLFKSWL